MSVEVSGIADVNRILMEIAPREAINLVRATVHDIASQLSKDAAANAPKDTGVLKKAIRPKRRRGDRTTVQSDVIVSSSAYYWRFLEYGDGPDGVAYDFFLNALQSLRPNVERVYLEAFARKLTARMARERKRK